MASDYLLEIEGVKGESRDKFHAETIELESWSWGLSNTSASVPAAGSGGGAGKASFQDIHFSARSDKSSPTLMLKCATGEHIKTAKLFVRKQGFVNGAPEPVDYYVVTLSDLLVSSFQAGSPPPTSESGVPSSFAPVDRFSLRFVKIDFTYTPLKADGSLDVANAVKAGWDIKANKKI